MNQNCSDLMAALKKQGGIEFIPAVNVQEAIDSIEATMGKTWASARGRRHVVHQLLDGCFIFVTKYYSTTQGGYVDTYATKVDDVYYDADGNTIEQVTGYRPLTEAERQERQTKLETAKTRGRRERLVGTRRTSSRRLAEAHRSTPTAPIAIQLAPVATTEESAFSRFVTPAIIAEHRIGELSLA